jgi:hypothetical protein
VISIRPTHVLGRMRTFLGRIKKYVP